MVELSQVGNKPDKKIFQWDGWHWNTITIQAQIMNGEACEIRYFLAEGQHGDSVAIKDMFSTDGCQLDDVTHVSVCKQNYEMYQDKFTARTRKWQLALFKIRYSRFEDI